jgi:hypothetical protein
MGLKLHPCAISSAVPSRREIIYSHSGIAISLWRSGWGWEAKTCFAAGASDLFLGCRDIPTTRQTNGRKRLPK